MIASTRPVWRSRTVVWPASAATARPARRQPRGGLWYHPPSRPEHDPFRAPDRPSHSELRFAHLAKTPRTWTGARTPSGLKRVRQAERRREVLQPRRSAAKTYVAKALTPRPDPPTQRSTRPPPSLEALSALDRAAKAGAIHPNAAARRKSRLTRKVNAALGGANVQTSAASPSRPARPPRPRPPRPASPPARPTRPRAPRPRPARRAPR